MPPKKQPTRSVQHHATSSASEIVDPVWLLKAAGMALAVAVLCAYVAISTLFYYAQWQLVLHPSRVESHQPADYGMNAESIHFAPDASGQPQLSGWWIASKSPASSSTILMLPSGDGSAGDWLARARTFQDAGLNVLLFDYRGFGSSAAQHPTEISMEIDSDAALAFLQTRGIRASSTFVFGAGAGASLATRLSDQHAELPGLILEQPDGDFSGRARADSRARIVPFGLLFHEDFPLAGMLRALKTPKLLIYYPGSQPSVSFQHAADPKVFVEFSSSPVPGPPISLQRFLDMYGKR